MPEPGATSRRTGRPAVRPRRPDLAPAEGVARGAGPSPLQLAAGFATVYLVWGSTYLAIRFAIETLPPFLMAGGRFLAAGAVLYAWARRREPVRPTLLHWRSAAIVGGLLLLGGNGGVVWSELRVPSGLAALLVATVPLWMVLLEGLRRGGTRPTRAVLGGVALGLAGVGILVGPGELGGGGADPIGALVLIGASLSWAIGSLYSRRAPLPASPLLGTAMEMLAGGALLTAAGTIGGEWGRLDLGAVSLASWSALAYLVVFGSLLGFTTYIWLLSASTPARVSTYAFVNPVVAVFLGWALADEPLTPRTLVAAAVIIVGVVLITARRPRASGVVGAPAASAVPCGTEGPPAETAPRARSAASTRSSEPAGERAACR